MQRDDPDAAAALETALKYLQPLERKDWVRPDYGVMKKDCKGFGEIRFKSNRNKVNQRPIGFFYGNSEFIILIFAIEKDRKLIPSTACQTVVARKRLVLRDKERYSHEWSADKDEE
ncbi:MAG: hypothetical protein GEU77_18110 [Deltaproteobacteria bacterium]|nr:hypothetical protein [Deltaproteobacteria bacterium]